MRVFGELNQTRGSSLTHKARETTGNLQNARTAPARSTTGATRAAASELAVKIAASPREPGEKFWVSGPIEL